ncbi:MAG: hypothetical protein MK085_03805 [Phycisphaerales bacterium]|nr:hypothetical protein [Phycisphaerales bacterium]
MRPCTILQKELASLAGVPDAVADMVVPLGEPDVAVASILEGNPLSDDWMAPLDVPGDHLVAWSGTLAQDLFGNEPRTWMKAGHDTFEAFCDQVAPNLDALDRTLLFRPHARHVLSDPQGSLDFLRRREQEPFGLALSPADMLLPSMLDVLEDHVERILTFVAPRARIIFLEDAQPGDDGESMQPAPLGEGVLPHTQVRELLHAHLPEEMPVVVKPSETATALEWLGIEH